MNINKCYDCGIEIILGPNWQKENVTFKDNLEVVLCKDCIHIEVTKITLKKRLIEFLTNNPQTLKTIYSEFANESSTTIRGRLNENIDKSFKRIGRGVYLAINGKAKALIIEGDAWDVIKEFDSDSIDAIITDSGYTCLNKHYEMGTSRKRNIGF